MPCLWNVKSKEYHDRNKRDTAYEKLVNKQQEIESNSVDKILNGHAYSRAVRGHILLHLALSNIVAEYTQIDDSTDEYFRGYINQIIKQNSSYEDVEGSSSILEPYIEQFNATLKNIQSRGPTTKLWVQYFQMVSIVKDFIRSERLGNWQGHLNAVKKMLPFFHTSGHYMQNQHIYICRICLNYKKIWTNRRLKNLLMDFLQLDAIINLIAELGVIW